MKVSWDFYSRRKNISLNKFLESVCTLEEALALFDRLNLEPPVDLDELWASRHQEKPEKSSSKKSPEPGAQESLEPKSKKTARPRRRRSKKSTEETSNSSDSKKQDTKEQKQKKEYFRKVIKK